jgi:hypothetical protein
VNAADPIIADVDAVPPREAADEFAPIPTPTGGAVAEGVGVGVGVGAPTLADSASAAAAAVTAAAAATAAWVLQQETHLQRSVQGTPYWKHTQYFFWQPLRRQLHPCAWRSLLRLPLSTLGWKALGLRLSAARTALRTVLACWGRLRHWSQLQSSQ